jgi:4-amino-4-deoxy-L-arabinose transferase-like glycosyltransferase
LTQPTPAIVAQNAVRRMPRIALLLLCAAYLMPGLLGRGPWKSADITAYGYMAELARTTNGLSRWFDPTLMGLRPDIPALIPYWIGALAIKLAPGWMTPDLAVRIVFALLLWGVLAATWYAAYQLARTPDAQPLAFAFGGEAQPTDYARAIADGALLALIACLGLAQLGHETTPALAQLFFGSSLFYGLATMPYHRRGAWSAVCIGILGLSLSGAPAVAVALGLGGALVVVIDHRRNAARLGGPYTTAYGDVTRDAPRYPPSAPLVIASITAGAALLVLALGLWRWQVTLPGMHPGKSLGSDLRSQAKLLLWFTWPAWPLVLWTLWRWRRQLAARHVALPLLFTAVPLAATWTTDFSDRSLLLALPAVATLAAFALPTLRRSVAALVDWFTLLFFSSAAVIIWGYWIAMQTGVPPKMAASVARLTPGFVPQFSWLTLMFAVAATLAWCWLVRWRTGQHRAALWKSLVLPGGGAALCWLLGTTLWLPALDYALSYAPQIRAIADRIQSVDGATPGRADRRAPCLALLGVGRSQIAALRHHGSFDLQPLAPDTRCAWMLVGPDAIASLKEVASFDRWSLVGTMRRPSSASDDLLLYRRSTP